MWRSLWRSIDRFSLQHFKHVINELHAIKVVDRHNMDLVIDLLQSIVEIVTYGDRQDPRIFECFMEYQVLAEFVRILRICKSSWIKAQLLQYLSIMIQNMDSEHAIYYSFSNDYINSIITHQYNFDGGDLVPYYISFLRAVSSKINRDTLCLLVRVHGDVVVSFPLYSEALKFAQHGEKMIQTAVRALTLNIYKVSDNMVYDFITTPPVSKYFTDVVHSMKEQCVHLDSLVHSEEEMSTSQRRKMLLLETDKLVDDLYYFKDILCVDDSRLSKMINQNLLHLLILPILFSLLQLRQNDGSNLSAITSIYVVSRVLQVVGGKDFTNSVARVILHPYMSLSIKDAGEGDTDVSFLNNSSDVGQVIRSNSWSEKEGIINGNTLNGHLPLCQLINSPVDDNVCPERIGIMAFILSDNPSLVLAALFLLLTLVESKDLEHALATVVGPVTMQHGLKCNTSDSQASGKSILVKFMPQVLNALLKVLASILPISVLVQWHTGWFLQKLLAFPGNKLDKYNIDLFNNSFEQSRECFQKALDGCWFDYVLDTLRGEWASCKTALEEPSQSKDPFFLLELVGKQQIVDDDGTSYFGWQTMVDAVKVFILHLQLKAFICTGKLLEKPVPDVMSSLPTASGRTHASDLSSASFGSEVSLGSGLPCRIAFSNAGTRDIYLIPVARGINGKLLLVERHPFRSQRGVVIAIAPLAGLSPRIDEDHLTWLHLKIREFDPSFAAKKGYNSKGANHAADGRWTVGFSNPEACKAAQLVILEETTKQRSFVGSVLAPLLENNFLGNLSAGQNEGDAPTHGV